MTRTSAKEMGIIHSSWGKRVTSKGTCNATQQLRAHSGTRSSQRRSKGTVLQDTPARPLGSDREFQQARALGSKPSPYSGEGSGKLLPARCADRRGQRPPAEPASTFDSPSSLCVTHTHLLGMKIQVLFKAAESLFCRNESARLERQRA